MEPTKLPMLPTTVPAALLTLPKALLTLSDFPVRLSIAPLALARLSVSSAIFCAAAASSIAIVYPCNFISGRFCHNYIYRGNLCYQTTL